MGVSFLGAFLLEEFFIRYFRDTQLPCRQVSLSIGALLANLEGVRLRGFLREKK